MALENYRITEFQEKTQVDNGDYVLIDSATDGTHKYQLSRIPAQASAEVAAAVAAEETAREAADAAEVTARNAAIGAAISEEVTARNAAIAANVDDTLTMSGKAADAKTVGDEIADVKSDLDQNDALIRNIETDYYDPTATSNMYAGYYTSDGYSGGTQEISSWWGTVVVKVNKGEKITISGCAENGGVYSAWLNSMTFTDKAKNAWTSQYNNGEHICETDYLGIATYNFSSVYKNIKVIGRDVTSEYAKKLNQIELIQNLATNENINVGKYYNNPPAMSSADNYRALSPIRLLAGEKISISFCAYAFTYFIPDGKDKQKMSSLSGGGALEYTALQDGYAYITYTNTADGSFMAVKNIGLPKAYIAPDVTLGATVIKPKQIIVVATDGSGDYTHPVDAFNSVQYSSEDFPVEIYIKSGTYSLNDKFVCPAQDTTGYLGIQLTSPYVSFVGEDPSTTILTFDGSPNEEQITSAQAMCVSIFHLNFDKPYYGTIKNLTLQVKNGRYVFHPETAGKGIGNWTVENCIFNFLGNPNVTGWDGATVGIGISHGETGRFLSCKWASNPTIKGVVGHNNAYGYSTSNIAVIPNAKLTFENCDFNGSDFEIDNLAADSPLHDMLYLINCAGINIGKFGFQRGQTAHTWVCINEGSEITDNQFSELT